MASSMGQDGFWTTIFSGGGVALVSAALAYFWNGHRRMSSIETRLQMLEQSSDSKLKAMEIKCTTIETDVNDMATRLDGLTSLCHETKEGVSRVEGMLEVLVNRPPLSMQNPAIDA